MSNETEKVSIIVDAEDTASDAVLQLAQKAEKAQDKQNKLAQAHIVALRAERIALIEGSEAAHRFTLEMQGLDKATAAVIAHEKALIEEEKKRAKNSDRGFQNTKASVEFFGTISNLSGSSAIGGIAIQLAQLTEKANAFNEVAKAGGSSGFMFKAGLAAAAAAAGFAVGKVIGDWAFETERWNRELEQSRALLTDLAKETTSLAQGQHEDRKLSFEFIRDPEAKKKAMLDYLDVVKKNVQSAAADVKNMQAEIAAGEASWNITGNAKQELENDKADLVVKKERLAMHRSILGEMLNLTNSEKERLAVLQKQWAAEEKSKDYVNTLREQLAFLRANTDEQARLTAEKNTVGANQGEAVTLLLQINAEKERQKLTEELDAARKRMQERDIADAQRLHGLYVDQARALGDQVYELQHGNEAARTRSLIQQGLDADFARNISHAQEIQKELEKERVTRVEREVNITGGRFINAVRGNDPTAQAVDRNTDEQKKNQALLRELIEINREIKNHPQFKVVL